MPLTYGAIAGSQLEAALMRAFAASGGNPVTLGNVTFYLTLYGWWAQPRDPGEWDGVAVALAVEHLLAEEPPH